MATLSRPDGHTVAYHRFQGVSPGVVFLGGFKSDMTGTKAMALEAWCRQHGRAYLRFDYLGHGVSSGRFEDGTIGRWADDATAALDQLTEGPQVLVGSSMGGWIMLLLALARSERIAGLVGIAVAPDFTEDLIWQALPDAIRQRLVQDGVLLRPSDYGDEPYPITLRLVEEARRHLLLRESIALHCPLRLMHGMVDDAVPWQTSLRLIERFAGSDARLTLIKDGEHRLSRDEDLTLLNKLLGEVIE